VSLTQHYADDMSSDPTNSSSTNREMSRHFTSTINN